MTTRTSFVLVDFENVQPKDIGLLKGGPFKLKVFLGPNQPKIPVSLVAALQPFGENAEYISLETAGSNALDFHMRRLKRNAASRTRRSSSSPRLLP